ncbi:MAG: divergent PAP2 family protein [Prevotella sp.]|nr:divergent PAP2 family protein [Prevotella sp.]
MKNILTLNPIISVGIISWFSAQILKTLIHLIRFKKFSPERIFGAGGMPSSHSALVISVMICTLRLYGFSDVKFALTAILAAIVIYDAMGVRYNAGLQARELNKLLQIAKRLVGSEDTEKPQNSHNTDKQKKLNELLGHKPAEVFAGALLGALTAVLFPI